MPLGWTNSPISPLHTIKTIVQVYLLQDSDLELDKSKIDILQDITNTSKHCIKSPTPERQCVEGIFQMQYPICAVNVIHKISRSSWTWHDLWKLLINFKKIYFQNSVDWSELYIQVYITSWLAKILTLTVFRLLEHAFVKLPCPYHDLIINPPCRTVP